MLHFNNRRVYVQTLRSSPATIGLQLKKRHICAAALVGLLACVVLYAQTPIPSPSPAPTPITKPGSILVNSPSTVGQITKWIGSSNNGIGTIGNSVITESSVGTIGIGTNPFSDFKLAVDGGSSGGVFGRGAGPATGVFGSSTSGTGVLGNTSNGIGVRGFSNSGTGVFGQSNTGLAGFFQGNVNVSGGDVSIILGGRYRFSDGTSQATAGITRLTAGTGLIGGGQGGEVMVAIGAGGVNTNQLADGAVTSAKLGAGAVTSAGLRVPLELSGSSSIPILSVANSGAGVALSALGSIETTTQYNIGGERVVSVPGTGNTFVGKNAGLSNVPGPGFPGPGTFNSFFGSAAGQSNIAGFNNAFFGTNAGRINSHAGGNAFFGANAGELNIDGSGGAFFGVSAGQSNTSGGSNSFFGGISGFYNTTGQNNSFFGYRAGQSNRSESNNTFIGAESNGAAGITNATALGANAVVAQSNSIVLGNNASVGIGTSTPQAKLHVASAGGTAGQFDGNVTITGNLSVSGAANLTATSFSGQITQSQVTNLIPDLASKANNSAVVHLAGAENITGNKSFGGTQFFSGNVGIGMVMPGAAELLRVEANTGAVAGSFVNNHNTNGNDALFAKHTGVGNAFHALNTQVIGRAGFFETSHGSNSSSTLETRGVGTGPAFKAANVGTGPAAVFTSGNVGIGTAAPQAKFHVANAGDTAGQFDGDVTISGNLNVASVNANNLSNIGTINTSSNPVDWSALKNVPSAIASGHFVNSINGLSSAVTLVAGDNVTITPSANTLTISAAGTGSSTPSFNPLQVATLRWYAASTNASFNVTGRPIGMAFDGSHMWVAHYSGGTGNIVSKVRTSDGAMVATFTSGPAGSWPYGLAFDGANVWVSNANDDTVSKLQARDGTLLGSYPAGAGPRRMAFDGANIWVADWDGGTVTKLKASDGTPVGTYPIGTNPHGVAFDGSNIWVTSTAGTVTKLHASDGSPSGTYNVGSGAMDVAFDGSNVWTVSGGANGTVTKLRASDGACVNNSCTFNTPHAIGIAFDGSNIWVTHRYDNAVTKIRASDGSFLGTFATGSEPYAVAFDGAYIWVTNWASASLSKF